MKQCFLKCWEQKLKKNDNTSLFTISCCMRTFTYVCGRWLNKLASTLDNCPRLLTVEVCKNLARSQNYLVFWKKISMGNYQYPSNRARKRISWEKNTIFFTNACWFYKKYKTSILSNFLFTMNVTLLSIHSLWINGNDQNHSLNPTKTIRITVQHNGRVVNTICFENSPRP